MLGHNMPEMMDLKSELKALKERGDKVPDLFLCVGQDDFLYEDITDFHGFLLEQGVQHRYDDLPGYHHEWRLWDMEVLEFLKWIPRTDEYASDITAV
jgi:putative tributyrin esterase